MPRITQIPWLPTQLPALDPARTPATDIIAWFSPTAIRYCTGPSGIHMRKKLTSSTVLLALLALSILHDSYTNIADAVVFTISDGTVPVIFLQVGSGGGTINQVNFDVPAANVGDGTAVDGDLIITFYLYLRATAANPLTGFLTVDSSNQLTSSGGMQIPMTDISWVSRWNDIPSDSFSGSANQSLASFVSSLWVVEQQRYVYSNQTIYEAGIYNGQVTYTWAAP